MIKSGVPLSGGHWKWKRCILDRGARGERERLFKIASLKWGKFKFGAYCFGSSSSVERNKKRAFIILAQQ